MDPQDVTEHQERTDLTEHQEHQVCQEPREIVDPQDVEW